MTLIYVKHNNPVYVAPLSDTNFYGSQHSGNAETVYVIISLMFLCFVSRNLLSVLELLATLGTGVL